MDEDDFDKLTLEERCVHKNWKARLSGYSSVAKLFKNLDDERSNEWNKYVHIIKNIVTDIHDPTLEKGLEVIEIFVEKSFDAGKTATQVMPLLVKKCIASPRSQTRALSMEICLKYTEIGKQAVVIVELLKGTDSKTPKMVSACIQVINRVINEFGTKIIEVNCLLGKVIPLLEDRDANVRNSSKALIVELYRWLGPSLKLHLDQLKPSKLSEVVADIAKIQELSPVPTRFLRSDLAHSTDQARDPSPLRQPDSNTSHCRDEIEPFNTLQPVDVLCQVPPEFSSQIRSRKWSERRDALESLEKILSQTKRIKNGDFTELITILGNVISKDTNIVVVCLAIKCISFFAMGLRTDLGSHVSSIFKVLSEKLKEKKNTIVCSLREAMDALFKCSSLDTLSADLIDSLGNKNPSVRSETALFLSRCFLLSTDLRKKTLKPLMMSLTTAINDQDPTVRNSAANALGVAFRMVGEKNLAHLLEHIDHQKMAKIKEYASSTEINILHQGYIERGTAGKLINVSNSSQSSGDRLPVLPKSTIVLKKCKVIKSHGPPATKNELNRRGSTPDSSSKSKNSKGNLGNYIPEAIMVGLAHENWAIRLQAVSDLKQNMKEINQIPNNVGEIVELLSSRILDNNPKIATTSISLITALAEKMGQLFKCHIPTFLPSLLKCIGDSKKWVSQPAVECLDSISIHCGYTEIFKDESLTDVLKSGSQTARVRLWQWFSKSLDNVTLKDIPRDELDKYLPPLFISLEDRNLEVRNNASMTVGRMVKLLGFNEVLSTCERYFKGQKTPLTKLLMEKNEGMKRGHGGDKTQLSSLCDSTSGRGTNVHTTQPHSENEVRNPLLDINNLKHQRVIDEHKNKIVKWEFTAPRAEFVDLLKSLMSAANFSQALMNHMFHDDFNYQLVAMDMLLDELQHNSQAVVSNLDLILRWLTLRFFDTCPIVLAKGLDFLTVTLDILKRMNYCFLDCEASTLVPYIVLKMADPRDNVHVKVKDILFKLCNLYPVSKLKKFVMDGLRTKSVRQKVNCLDVLKSFIDIYGETVYIKDLDIIAERIVKLLNDRDAEIKKGAFSVTVSLFSQEGEKMLKFIEKFAGEDGPTIEQRVRKFATARQTASDTRILPQQATSSALADNVNPQSCAVASTDEMLAPERKENVISDTNRPFLSGRDTKSDMFKLDLKLLEELESTVNVPLKSPNLIKVDLEFLKDEKQDSKLFSFRSTDSCKLHYSSLNPREHNIDDIVNDDLVSSIKAMKEIDELLNSEKQNFSLLYIDAIVHKIAQQLRKLAQINNMEHLRCYGSIFTLLLTLCSTKRFVDRISRTNLCFLLEQLLSLISNNIFDERENENYRAAVNTIILKILVNGRKTDLLCGLLEMMGGSKDKTLIAGKIHDLYMKCLWKLNRSHPSWDAELDYCEVFKSIRILIKTYDFPWWTSKVNDNSLRTMKTILRTMVKMRGQRIVSDAKIDSSSIEDSGLEIYVRKLLQMRLTKKGVLELEYLPKHNLLMNHAHELSDIFKTVSTNPTVGMERLNKFSEAHPTADFRRIISKVSPALFKYFLWFKRQRNIFQEAPSETDGESRVTGDIMSRDDFSEEVRTMWDRLKVLQERIRSA